MMVPVKLLVEFAHHNLSAVLIMSLCVYVCVFVCVRVCASAAYNADLILALTQLVYIILVLIYGNLAFSALYFSSFLCSATFFTT